MTPANADAPLRRSEAAKISVNAQNVTINDDDEERRRGRRTILELSSISSNDTGPIEENETLKRCLEIYNCNKLSRDNAWSMSVIDTLSALLDRHHKSLNNFKVAGSSLEASSRVYSLRVDSIHIDVLRLTAGLNAQKFKERNMNGNADDDEDGVAPNNSSVAAAGAELNADDAAAPKARAKKKRQRRVVSTITKNKETLNARLDTVPLQDPVFGKLNSTVGSINSSSRLMNNVLSSVKSELQLRMTFRFWDSEALSDCDYTALASTTEEEVAPAACDLLFQVERYEELQIRPEHSGYVITDTPEAIPEDREPIPDDQEPPRFLSETSIGTGAEDRAALAFDINAECEPMPSLCGGLTPMLDVDDNNFEDFTAEERSAIGNCRGLRRAPVMIEDLRPVDSSSKLEYSYRPLDKISQFWAGPSHWKFRRVRTRGSSLLAPQLSVQGQSVRSRAVNQRMLEKRRTKQLKFDMCSEELFSKKLKSRKVNLQKKWDLRKLKLPTDLQLDALMFYRYEFAPGIGIPDPDELIDEQSITTADDIHADDGSSLTAEHMFGEHFAGGASGDEMMECAIGGSIGGPGDEMCSGSPMDEGCDAANNTVLEIATNFVGAPTQVTKVVVPFAKRAKVINMKSLKRSCNQLLTRQMMRPIDEAKIPKLDIPKAESYASGVASFKEIYSHLPEMLTENMTNAVTPSIAMYSVLHLANDYHLRLIQEENLEDFKIRQIVL